MANTQKIFIMKRNGGDTIIIIGAGISGLAAGCYAQMNGYRSQIFEMHDQPGGLCTAWHRQGFTFDGCIHYLFGSGPGQPFHWLWEELGVVPEQKFFHHDELLRVSGPQGKTLIVYSDPDRLEQHLKELSPVDRHLISKFCAGIRTFTHFDLSLGDVRLFPEADKPVFGSPRNTTAVPHVSF
jgi:phytoene dehydrogenase-like protein